MSIYDENGDLDFDAAARDLEASSRIQNDGIRRDTVARIQTGALLDIAVSLRILAAEAGAAMGVTNVYNAASEAEPVDEIARDFLVVGDLVHVIGETEPGEVVAVGSDSGDPWATVDFATTKGMRYYWRNLERLVGDAATGAPFDPAVAAALNAEADDEPDLADELELLYEKADALSLDDVADAIDADFDGDTHTAAEAALERLRENEAKRKAEKKATKKGTKK